MLRQKIDTADIQARKACLNAVISEMRVGDDKIQIVGDKASLAAVIAGQQAASLVVLFANGAPDKIKMRTGVCS